MEHRNGRNVPFHVQNGMETKTKLTTIASQQVHVMNSYTTLKMRKKIEYHKICDFYDNTKSISLRNSDLNSKQKKEEPKS